MRLCAVLDVATGHGSQWYRRKLPILRLQERHARYCGAGPRSSDGHAGKHSSTTPSSTGVYSNPLLLKPMPASIVEGSLIVGRQQALLPMRPTRLARRSINAAPHPVTGLFLKPFFHKLHCAPFFDPLSQR